MEKRVAIIGAGATGLVALRHLTRHNDVTPVMFEMTSQLSGTWVYTDRTGQDELGLPIHSSMYANLKTNIPIEAMMFPDFHFPEHLPSFVGHEDVRQYLEDYATHFDLHKYIQYHTRVMMVTPWSTSSGGQGWEVEVMDVRKPNSCPLVQLFDAVIVANGHYASPLYPTIPGQRQFEGVIFHSHDYRSPEKFTGMVVAILGASASGQDISMDLAPVAQHIYLCHKDKLLVTVPNNVTQRKVIKEMRHHSIIVGEQEIQVDAIIYCTGYKYNYNFLSPQCGITTTDERVTPLYKHIVSINHPSLFLIGVLKKICPFPQFDGQAQFITAAITHQMVLPSIEEMKKDIDRDRQWRCEQGFPTRHAHTMGVQQWAYNKELARLGGFQPIKTVTQNIWQHSHTTRLHSLTTFKNISYQVLNDEQFATK